MKKINVAVLVGSLRRESLNLKMANALIEMAPESMSLELVDLSQIEMYNEDLDEKPPKAWTQFRSDIAGHDAVLFLTPEYNRSMPAVLKNAIDVGSRPSGQNVWNGKPGAIISVTPYTSGAFGANHHLRQALVYVNVPVMAQPEAYVSHAADLFGKDGKLTNPKTKTIMQTFLKAFETWANKNL